MKLNKEITKTNKGYDTYINDKGVKCITNFDPYNLGPRIKETTKTNTGIKERRLPSFRNVYL